MTEFSSELKTMDHLTEPRKHGRVGNKGIKVNIFDLFRDPRSLLDRKREEKNKKPRDDHKVKERMELSAVLQTLRDACPEIAKNIGYKTYNALSILQKTDDSTPTCTGKFHTFLRAKQIVSNFSRNHPFCVSPEPDRLLDSLRTLWPKEIQQPDTLSDHWVIRQYDEKEAVSEFRYLNQLSALSKQCKEIVRYKVYRKRIQTGCDSEKEAHQFYVTFGKHNTVMQQLVKRYKKTKKSHNRKCRRKRRKNNQLQRQLEAQYWLQQYPSWMYQPQYQPQYQQHCYTYYDPVSVIDLYYGQYLCYQDEFGNSVFQPVINSQ